MNSNC